MGGTLSHPDRPFLPRSSSSFCLSFLSLPLFLSLILVLTVVVIVVIVIVIVIVIKVLLSLCVIHEQKKGLYSRWAPWLASFPSLEKTEQPIGWSEDDAAFLQNSPVIRQSFSLFPSLSFSLLSSFFSFLRLSDQNGILSCPSARKKKRQKTHETSWKKNTRNSPTCFSFVFLLLPFHFPLILS